MLKGRVGRLYWGRCLIRAHRGHGVYGWANHYSAGMCVFGRFVEWTR